MNTTTTDEFRPVLRIGGSPMSLPALLRASADVLEHGARDTEEELLRAVERIAALTVEAVHRQVTPEWAEYRLARPDDHVVPQLYAALADCARTLLAGPADDFFFMHKSPGLRVRFRMPAQGPARDKAITLLEERFTQWQGESLISHWHPAVYEPESHIFGGPTSMRSVHRLFTADSLAWADYWARSTSGRPAWAQSLVMLEALLSSLGIVGWEDRDVWDRLRRQGQRQLPGSPPEGWTGLCRKIHQVWTEPGRLAAAAEPWAAPYADAFRRAAARECPPWIERYFTAEGATVGAREAAAFFVVYHWNRARLPFEWQCAIAEALVQ